MGLKTTARKIIAEADVPVVPGYGDDEQHPNKLRGKVEAIGLPILIKASAGGGGKGMRVVRDASEMTAAIESAWREAEKAFGTGLCFWKSTSIERGISKYRSSATTTEI
jgi:3-methylcrotonyl-CoA carboxylase alpha subunit